MWFVCGLEMVVVEDAVLSLVHKWTMIFVTMMTLVGTNKESVELWSIQEEREGLIECVKRWLLSITQPNSSTLEIRWKQKRMVNSWSIFLFLWIMWVKKEVCLIRSTHTSLPSRSTSWIIHSLSNRFGEVGWMQNEVIVLVWNRIRNRAFCIRFRILCWHSKKILLDCSSITSMSQFKLNYSKQIECSNCESSQFDLNNPIVWLTLGPLARALHRVITFCGMFLDLFLLALYVRWQHDPQGVYYYGNIIGPSQWTWISRAWWWTGSSTPSFSLLDTQHVMLW